MSGGYTTIYHGTNAAFNVVELSASKEQRDFGRGFYTTSIFEQARSWALNMNLRYGGGRYVYEFSFQPSAALRVKTYDGLTPEWLNMVKENRLRGGIQHDYDIIIGPVANDNTMRTVALYVSGIYTAEMAMEQLRYFKANDQVSFHTKAALESLRMIRRIDL